MAASLSAAHVGKISDALPKKEICWTCVFKESIPAIPFCEYPSIHSLQQKLEVPESCSTLQQLCILGCIMPIPSLQLQKEDLSYAEKQRVWSRSCGLQELFEMHTDCSSMTAAKEGFSLRGLEAGLPAFQLLMFSKCDWKEMWGMLFCKDIQLYNEEIRESVRQGWIIRVGSHNAGWKSPGSMFQLWINDGFEWFYALNFLYPEICCPRSTQATHTHASHCDMFD